MKNKFSPTFRFSFFSLLGLSTLLALPLSARAIGFRECTEQCYVKECGEMGVRCPTVTQKRMYRRKCKSRCRDVMAQQAERRRRERVLEAIRIEERRAARHRKMILLRHRLWKERKLLRHRLKMQYERAKQRRQAAAARSILRKMQLAHDQQMQYMREKLMMKEKFYRARQRIRHKQRMEARRQVVRLKKQMLAARSKHNKEKVKQIMGLMRQRHRQMLQARRQEAVLHVRYYETRVNRRKHHIKAIHVQKKRVKKEQVEAKKSNNKEKIKKLARRLGKLAGQQAALSRQADLDQIKLQKARVALKKASSSKSSI